MELTPTHIKTLNTLKRNNIVYLGNLNDSEFINVAKGHEFWDKNCMVNLTAKLN